jgi:hypothetical protein
MHVSAKAALRPLRDPDDPEDDPQDKAPADFA